MKKSLSFLIVLVVLLCSCSEDDKSTNPEVTSPTTLLPLKINNSWNYEDSDSNLETIKIYSSDEVSGRTIYRFSLTRNDVGLVQDGNWFLIGEFETNQWDVDEKFKFPEVSIGDEWEQDGRNYKLYNKDVAITTKAGTFDCYEYHSNDNEENSLKKYYISPTVGIIRTEEYSLDNVTRILAESSLTSYLLN